MSYNRVAAYRDVLDHISEGIHEIDADGRLIFVNRAERERLGIREDWLAGRPHVAELSPANHEAKQSRVGIKITEGVDLTNGEHRSFRKSPHEPLDSPHRVAIDLVPVNIRDVPIAEPDRIRYGRQNRGLITLVTDPSILEGISRYLEKFGPRNPLLESIGVSTFVAVLPQHATLEERTLEIASKSTAGLNGSNLVFTYGNGNFVSELVKLTSRYPNRSVKSMQDILGRTQAELWNFPDDLVNFGDLYAAVDRAVMQHGRSDQRIESHVSASSRGSTNVQVIKFPHYHSDPEKSGEVIGVEGYYWEVGDGNPEEVQVQIRRRLETLYRPFDILDNIPLPVYMKDMQLRFIYANSAYISDLARIQESLIRPVKSLHDVIGRTDHEIFPERYAKEYESDDFQITMGREAEIDRLEMHGHEKVRVNNRAITNDAKIVGVQGIFWRPG